MVQVGKSERFLAKPLAGSVIGERSDGQDFQGYVALEFLIARAVDNPHAAGADLVEDAVLQQGLAEH
jgi:hypothetical protein